MEKSSAKPQRNWAELLPATSDATTYYEVSGHQNRQPQRNDDKCNVKRFVVSSVQVKSREGVCWGNDGVSPTNGADALTMEGDNVATTSYRRDGAIGSSNTPSAQGQSCVPETSADMQVRFTNLPSNTTCVLSVAVLATPVDRSSCSWIVSKCGQMNGSFKSVKSVQYDVTSKTCKQSGSYGERLAIARV
ncbi:hypothetical protein PC128_g14223 [Phytophthora cactorum]|nr:hypothetical protein PC128_g14223 [Phytophthora cactorum]